MNRFSYMRAASVEEAVREVAGDPTARFIAGGNGGADGAVVAVAVEPSIRRSAKEANQTCAGGQYRRIVDRCEP